MISYMTDSFLGNSATFLGCIFTLVVLCLFFDEANYILRLLKLILSESKDEVEREVHQHENTLKEATKNAKDIESEFPVENISSNNLLMMNRLQTLSTLSQSAVFRMKRLSELIKRLDLSDEFVGSSLYTFLFCIIVFIADELYIDSKDVTIGLYCLNAVYLFSLISIYIWLLKWIYFCFHIDNRKLSPSRRYHFNWLITSVLILGLPAVSVGACFLIDKFSPFEADYNAYLHFFLIGVAILGIIAIIVFWNNEFRFTISFIMRHFICIISSMSILFFIVGKIETVTIIASPEFVRRIALLAALLTGIILPFLIPLCKFCLSIFIISIDNNKDKKLLHEYDKQFFPDLVGLMLTSKKQMNKSSVNDKESNLIQRDNE
ncbi:MAG: hypothetical protein PEPC_01782 [Peptostreptococcus russellii]